MNASDLWKSFQHVNDVKECKQTVQFVRWHSNRIECVNLHSVDGLRRWIRIQIPEICRQQFIARPFAIYIFCAVKAAFVIANGGHFFAFV